MNDEQLNILRRQDRIELEAVLTTINGAHNALRRDQCGDWTITGAHGTIRVVDGTVYAGQTFEHSTRPAYAWVVAKRELKMTVTQDGEDEGVVTFGLRQRLSKRQVMLLRRYVGIRQTRVVKSRPLTHLKGGRQGPP